MATWTWPHSNLLAEPGERCHWRGKLPSNRQNSTLHLNYGFSRFAKKKVLVCPRTNFRVQMAKSDTNTERATTVSANGGNSASSFLSILCPLLKVFAAGDPSRERNDFLEIATSSLSSLARLPWGSSLAEGSHAGDVKGDHLLYLQLFEFEACPFCRRVREAMTELDLSAELRCRFILAQRDP